LIALLQPPPPTKGGHLQLLDLMRGFAAFAILFWHYHHFSFAVGATHPVPANYRDFEPLRAIFWPLYDHGKYAVLLFWLLSGFVFSHVYTGRQASTRAFVVARFARLYPLHLLTLLVVAGLQALCVARLGGAMIYQHNGWPEFLAQLAFASNWAVDAPYSFNAPIWTVSVEIPVYVLFWLLLPMLFRFGIALPGALTLAFGYGYMLLPGWHLLSAFQCFFAGAALFAACRALGTAGKVALGAGLVAIGIGGCLEVALIRPVGGLALCAALVLALVMVEPLPRPAWLARLNWLGDAGYGIYLWHFPIQLCLFLTFSGFATARSPSHSPWFLALFFGLAIAAGHLSYRWIERPANRWLRMALGGGQR
jgi:peptidoglycan/LPS O-acetylase OafA/YrhL